MSRNPLLWATALSALILTLPTYRLIDAHREPVLDKATAEAIHKEGDATREWLRVNLIPIAQQVADNANARTGEALGIVRDAERDSKNVLQSAVQPLSDSVIVLHSAIQKADSQITGLRSDAAPVLAKFGGTLDASTALVKDVQDSWDDLYFDVKASVASGAVAVAGIGRAADEVAKAAPAITFQVARGADEYAETGKQTRIFMTHLSDATKPLPAWVRIGLAVAPPIVQTGFTTASWLAVRGKEK